MTSQECRPIGFDWRTSAAVSAPAFATVREFVTDRVEEVISFDSRICCSIQPPSPQEEVLISFPGSEALFSLNLWSDLDALLRAAVDIKAKAEFVAPALDPEAGLYPDPFPQNISSYLLGFGLIIDKLSQDFKLTPSLPNSQLGNCLTHEIGYSLCSWDGYDAVWDFVYSAKEYGEMAELQSLNRYGLFATLDQVETVRKKLPVQSDDGHWPFFIFQVLQIGKRPVRV
jgi:hypothetical protein